MKGKLLTILAAAAMFTACTETSISDINSETKEVGTVDITVYNARNRMPIDEADVYSFDMNKHRYTDSTGKIIWNNFEIGDLWFDINKKGFARVRKQVHITDIIANDVARVENLHLDVNMYELGMDVSGKVYYKDLLTGNLLPAAGVTVIATYSDGDIYPSETTVKTDDDGAYTFKNMPVGGVTCEFKTARAVIDDVVYDITALGSASGLRVGDVEKLDLQVMPRLGLVPKMLSSNLSSLDVESDIKLLFSEELEADSIRIEHINVQNAAGKSILVDVSLDEDGKTVIVKPTSGKWVDAKDYTLTYQVWTKVGISSKNSSAADAPVDEDFTIGSVNIPGKANGIKLMDDPAVTIIGNKSYLELDDEFVKFNAFVAIEWDEVENATGYRIYYKGNTDASADYVKAGEVLDVTKFSYTFGAYEFDGEDPSEVTFKVIPFNAAGQALGDEAKEFDVNIGGAAEDKFDEWKSTDVQSLSVSLNPGSLATTCGTKAVCTADADNLSGEILVEWDKPKNVNPNGYNIYVQNEDDEWVYAGTTTNKSFVIYAINEASPFRNGDLNYTEVEDKSVSVMVRPYYTTNWVDEFGTSHTGKVETDKTSKADKTYEKLINDYDF